MEVTTKGIVSGKVQGVWFRKFVQGHAEENGVTGYAANLPDGTVEVLLSGDSAAVLMVQAQVSVGPPDAEVDQVVWEDSPLRGITGFSVR
ncbi:acylphosphatase [Porticoccaceae bacterium LTM1]|nr:acylphosphatase [Porticoccaceae bacterium LTM1]